MKVVAFNGSPRMEQGNTAAILLPFLDGMAECGAETEVFYTQKLNIAACQSDLDCWVKTPGQCGKPDDMQMLYPKLREADVWVFASPVYVWGVTGPMKNLIDRVISLVEPFIRLRNGHCTHPVASNVNCSKIVLVATCGFYEMDNFDPILAQMEAFCKVIGFEFAGALLRPHAPALTAMLERGAPVRNVLDAARDAGKQLATAGVMAKETLEAVSRPLLPLQMYLEAANNKFEKEIRAAAAAATKQA